MTTVATLGGGCFWCLQPVFEELKGVEKVVVGYAGGHVPNPTYKQVCRGSTGHAEVVQITFDESVLPFKRLLEVFFHVHDPTTPNRQGADVGSQYRSIILYHDEEQRRVAEEVMARIEASGLWAAPLVTELVSFEAFYPAEDGHQGYYRKNPNQPYCRVVIDPKLAKFRRTFSTLCKPAPGGR